VINVMPSAGTIHKSDRIRNRPSVKPDDFLANLNQNYNNNSNENCAQFTTDPKYKKIKVYKNCAKRNNLRFIDSDSNQVLRIYNKNICGLGSKTNDLLLQFIQIFH